MAVDLIIAAVERSAAPAAVANALQQLRERDHALGDRLLVEDELRDALLSVLAASRSLTRLLIADPVDVDVLFAGGDEAAARAAMDVARTCFRVDADLRPEGRNGPLTRTLDSYRAYWGRWADAWEFQALLKARAVAGDADLGRAFASAA